MKKNSNQVITWRKILIGLSQWLKRLILFNLSMGTFNHESGHIITILSHKLPFVSLTFSLINIQNVTRKTRKKGKKILRLMICHFPSFQKSNWLLKKWLHPSEKTFLTSVKLMQLMLKMWSFPECSWKIWHILTHLPHSRFSFIAAHKAHISEVSVSHEYYLEHQRKLQSQFTMNWRTTVYTMYLKAYVLHTNYWDHPLYGLRECCMSHGSFHDFCHFSKTIVKKGIWLRKL